MKHMSRKYKPEDAMLRPAHESTLDKQQKKRQEHNPPLELAEGGKGEMLNKKENARMRRKEALSKAMNKYHDPDIVG
jgi:hypothetical protein